MLANNYTTHKKHAWTCTWTETVSHYSRSAACMGYQNPDGLLFPITKHWLPLVTRPVNHVYYLWTWLQSAVTWLSLLMHTPGYKVHHFHLWKSVTTTIQRMSGIPIEYCYTTQILPFATIQCSIIGYLISRAYNNMYGLNLCIYSVCNLSVTKYLVCSCKQFGIVSSRHPLNFQLGDSLFNSSKHKA